MSPPHSNIPSPQQTADPAHCWEPSETRRRRCGTSDAFAQITARRPTSQAMPDSLRQLGEITTQATSVSDRRPSLLLFRVRFGGDQIARAAAWITGEPHKRPQPSTMHTDRHHTMATTLCADDRWLLRRLPAGAGVQDG